MIISGKRLDKYVGSILFSNHIKIQTNVCPSKKSHSITLVPVKNVTPWHNSVQGQEWKSIESILHRLLLLPSTDCPLDGGRCLLKLSLVISWTFLVICWKIIDCVFEVSLHDAYLLQNCSLKSCSVKSDILQMRSRNV